MAVDLAQARAFLRQKEARRQAAIEVRFQEAWRDFRAIVTLIAERYRPTRVYQWGSLLHRPHFCEWSDIDIAVEGLGSAERFFALHRDADSLTRLPLDLVEMERIEPEFADIIRMKGIVVYDRNLPDPGPHFRAG
jgi:predicted nucleotidyltransferase